MTTNDTTGDQTTGEPESERSEAKPTATAGRLSRRSLLSGGALLGGGLLVGAGAGIAATGAVLNQQQKDGTEPFWGEHQSGVTTDTQRNAVLAAFDITSTKRSDLIALLKAWTQLASSLTQGSSTTIPVFAGSGVDAYADTTGSVTTDDSLEAWQLGSQRLTLTIGFGRSVFTQNGDDRFGLAHRLPAALVEIPRFAGDELDESQSGGDLYVQSCADDPQVAFHAVRSLARVAPDVATLRWTQVGFSPSNTGGTPRNLMGFKDGTMNSNAHPPKKLAGTVWAGSEGPEWMNGGSYLVYRRIRMALEHWDRLAPNLQEQVIGRHKLSGAPIGAQNEFDPLDLSKKTADGTPAIPTNAHVRLAAPEMNDGAVILRRAFSYNNGTTPFIERWPPWRQALEYDSGLLFLAFQTDPRTAFIPMNQRLSESDALNQFTTHTASAIFAVPPGARAPGDWIGSGLFA